MATDNPSNHLELVQGRSPGARPVSSPGVLKHIEESALASSRQLMEHMFSATDDLFYELSKRASSNNEQNLYFESMREIRIKKEGLIGAFLQKLSENFTDILTNKSSKPSTAREDEEVNLSIVEGDELEIDLALKNMSNRAKESYKNEIYELAIRLDHLLLQSTVTEENNPLNPFKVSEAFVLACLDKLKISIKTRLILFKLFEKHVLKQLGHIYSDANHLLIEAGILPKVPKSLIKNASGDSAHSRNEAPEKNESARARGAASSNLGPDQTQESIAITPEALATLMTAVRNAPHSGVNGVPYAFYASNPGPALAVQDLVNILTSKQPIVDHRIARSEPKVVLRDLVNELLSKNNPTQPNSLKQTEEDTINLVALFFDQILEDPDLPIVVQSLICRLQIPVLKVALRDASFLTNYEHPARKLINSITKAGLQFDDSKPLERDPLYRTIVDGIQTINRQQSADDSVFAIIQSEIDELLQKESRKSHIVESRTTQTEMGKAKVRNAKAYAQTTLFDKLKDQQLPGVISNFLTNTWLQVLVITYIKEGNDGAKWVENEQLISDLVWLCKAHQDERSKARAQRIKPEILTRIENGLELAIDNPETRKTRISEIEQIISSVITGIDIADVEFKGLDNSQIEALGRADDSNKSWDEMTALERQQSQYEELSSKFFTLAKEIKEGRWVEFQETDGKLIRCKLSKKIDADNYLFVNRFGFKVKETSRRQLAYDMQFSRAKVLNSAPIVDRIFESLLNRFQDAA